LAAILALAIVIGGSRAGQGYAQSLAAHYIRVMAPADVPIKYLTLTFQRAALADATVLPLYGSSDLYWANDPRRAPQFYQSAPTGFSVFAVGHAGTGDLFFAQTFAALGANLRGRLLAVEDSSVWFYNPVAVPAQQYAGNFSPEIASMFLFDAPISQDLREGGARSMLDFPDTLNTDDLIRVATESLADPSFWNLLAYYAIYPAGRLDSWVLQVQDAGQTVAFIDSHPTLQPDPPPQPRAVNWPDELQTATRQARALSTNNPFGIADDGYATLRDNIGVAPLYSATMLYCFGKTNRFGAVYPYPADWEQTMESSHAWNDLSLELQVLNELGAHPLVYTLPLAGAYDDYTEMSEAARQSLYSQYRATTGLEGVTALDLSGHDEDAYFLRDPIDHLSPRGWIFVDRALDSFWHNGSVATAAQDLEALSSAVPPPSLLGPAAYCEGSDVPPGSTTPAQPGGSPGLSHQLPWGDGPGPSYLVGSDAILSSLSAAATDQPGQAIPVTFKAVAANQPNHFMLVARLIDQSGAIRSEARVANGPVERPLTAKAGDPLNLPLNLPVATDTPRGMYQVQLSGFHLPTSEALPILRTGGAAMNSILVGNVLIAPPDYLPAKTLPKLGGTVQALSDDLGGDLNLVGATAIQRDGADLSFDLFWRAAHHLDQNYTIFVQLLDHNGRLVAQSDSFPWAGRYPTSAWQPGLIVRDSYRLTLPSDGSAGPYQVIVGAYRLDTLQRLAVVDASGRSLGDHVSLAQVSLP
jgi:D-alanine transfer protein